MLLSDIADLLTSKGVVLELIGSHSSDIVQVASLNSATAQNISFLNDSKYLPALTCSQAGAVILTADDSPACPVPHLIVNNPYYVYALVAQILNPVVLKEGVHTSAVVDETVCLLSSVSVGANAVIEQNVV
ncbi:MAG: UDP-3-O-(3-hydroxymyristoyl)glucosamine N-acyltransferase, partial [Gammaproteobacteria bacterium]|nr:UDP-3-O-(3-hydroxymyristoyl)glucosamine N-acyltransferase [Gammaproteobacteria bacterium]